MNKLIIFNQISINYHKTFHEKNMNMPQILNHKFDNVKNYVSIRFLMQ